MRLARTRSLSITIASLVALTACSALVGRDLEQDHGTEGAFSDGGVQPDGTTGGGDAAGDAQVAPLADGNTPGDTGSQDCAGANLQTDAKNCGRCGHDCGPGACAAGVCQAWTLVPGQPGSANIAIDGTSIYWTSEPTGQVMKSDKDGKSLAVLSFIKDTSPYVLAIDATNVYWSEDSSDTPVRRCPKTGCDAGGIPMTSATFENTGAIAVDGTNVYVAEYSWGAIARASKGATNTSPAFLLTHLDHAYGLAADDAGVFFSTSSIIGRASPTGPTSSSDTGDAGTYTTLLGTVSNAIGLIVAPDGNLYWCENNDVGAVKAIPKTGASVPTVFSATEQRPLGVAVDDTNVYWTAEGANSSTTQNTWIYTNGYVAMCPKTGCPASGPVKLASGLHNPGGIVVDDKAIYFTIFGNPGSSGTTTEGSIMKAFK